MCPHCGVEILGSDGEHLQVRAFCLECTGQRLAVGQRLVREEDRLRGFLGVRNHLCLSGVSRYGEHLESISASFLCSPAYLRLPDYTSPIWVRTRCEGPDFLPSLAFAIDGDQVVTHRDDQRLEAGLGTQLPKEIDHMGMHGVLANMHPGADLLVA